MKFYRDNIFNELIIDNFAGGGGASIGIELATGRPVDIAINHDADAIAMHKVNHPFTKHYKEDVFAINPEEVTGGRPVGIAWFSPDCKHFSRAKGGKPVEHKVRGLSWVILKWAMSRVAPRCIFMENVEEIQTWGPLINVNGKLYPDPEHAGETFQGFISMFTTGISKSHPAFSEACSFLNLDPCEEEADRLARGLGYKLDYKILKACDYGAPTIRKRFYLIARNDGQPIVFPKPTHGKAKGLKPYRTAAECINWSIPCPSIFERKKPLVENTLRRIARGLDKFVIKNPKPYILEMNFENQLQDVDKPMTTQTSANHHYLITPSLVQYHTEQNNREVRGQKVDKPIQTVDTQPRYAVNSCYLTKYFSGNKQAGAAMDEPNLTVTAIDHNALVAANLVHYYSGADHASNPDAPLPTVTVQPRHYLVAENLCVLRKNMDGKPVDEPLATMTASAGHFAEIRTYFEKIDGVQNLLHWNEVREILNKYAGYNIADNEILIFEINGEQRFIGDIGMRMLKAEELKLAQGFPTDYVIDIETYIGKKYSEAKQIARLGNAVCPPVATALIRANCADMAYKKPLNSVAELEKVMCV